MTIPQVLTVIDLVYTTISTNQLLTPEKEGILRKHRYTIIPFSSIYCSHSPGSTMVSAKIKKQHLHAYFSAKVQSYEIKLCTPLSTLDELEKVVVIQLQCDERKYFTCVRLTHFLGKTRDRLT